MAQVPLTTSEEFKAAVFAAKRAFPIWRNTPVTTRQRIMFKLQELIRRDVVSEILCAIIIFLTSGELLISETIFCRRSLP